MDINLLVSVFGSASLMALELLQIRPDELFWEKMLRTKGIVEFKRHMLVTLSKRLE
jgi:hypothetical protein